MLNPGFVLYTSSSGVKVRPFHVLRSLLRQCTYLPDPAARAYFHKYFVDTYRDYLPRNSLGKGQKRPAKDWSDSRFRRIEVWLRWLRRANHGDPRSLSKVLSYTYGRAGERRHKLLADIKRWDNSSDQQSLEKAPDINHDWRDTVIPKLPPRLLAVAKSQRSHQKAQTRGEIRHLEPQIPEKNMWERPMPRKRVKNMAWKWYLDLCEKILPPLPPSEWKRLRNLALGNETPPLPHWRGHGARQPSSTRRRKNRVDDAVESVGTLWALPARSTNSHDHYLTTRFMRRLWSEVFIQCPMLSWDAGKNVWTVEWGKLPDPMIGPTAKQVRVVQGFSRLFPKRGKGGAAQTVARAGRAGNGANMKEPQDRGEVKDL